MGTKGKISIKKLAVTFATRRLVFNSNSEIDEFSIYAILFAVRLNFPSQHTNVVLTSHRHRNATSDYGRFMVGFETNLRFLRKRLTTSK